MTIAFIHPQKAFLPEIAAYKRFFEPLGIVCKTVAPDRPDAMRAKVEWHFMGMDMGKRKKGIVTIHEYLSGSTAPFRRIKDLGKSWLNQTPDFRLFLNQYVRSRFTFRQDTPYGYRDMGVPASWLSGHPSNSPDKKYDFVYIGNLSASRKPERLVELFSNGPFKQRNLLLLCHRDPALENAYRKNTNIIFNGPVDQDRIPALLQQARFGINYIPDRPPFNQQTSTKLLEYAACGLPIVSTRYRWAEEFQRQYGGGFFYLPNDLSTLSWEDITGFNFSAPDLSAWTWEKQIRKSGVVEFLESVR